jgi:hypothetical protein
MKLGTLKDVDMLEVTQNAIMVWGVATMLFFAAIGG